jgi:hypothetical protein
MTGRWELDPSLPIGERPEADAAVVGDRVYIAGGQRWDGGPEGAVASDSLLVFDAVERRFLPSLKLPTRVDHALLVEYGGDLYLVGGFRDNAPVADLWRYSPRDGSWTRLPSMQQPRGGHAGDVIDGALFVVGGAPPAPASGYVQTYSTLEIYDFATREWTKGPDMPTSRHHTTAVAVEGRLLVFGGRREDDLAVDGVERFDPVSGAWERLDPLPLAVAAADAAATDRFAFLTGGADDTGWWDGAGYVTPAAWVFDSEGRLVARLPDLRVPRHAHAAAIAAGRLFVFSGIPCPGAGMTATVESIALPRTLVP